MGAEQFPVDVELRAAVTGQVCSAGYDLAARSGATAVHVPKA
jgi:hypothetical protein